MTPSQGPYTRNRHRSNSTHRRLPRSGSSEEKSPSSLEGDNGGEIIISALPLVELLLMLLVISCSLFRRCFSSTPSVRRPYFLTGIFNFFNAKKSCSEIKLLARLMSLTCAGKMKEYIKQSENQEEYEIEQKNNIIRN